jgi:hypothetical protein
MSMSHATLDNLPLPSPSQMADLRLAASNMTGPTRRAFEAEMTLKYCGGNPLMAEAVFGWGRQTVALGVAERHTGIVCLALTTSWVLISSKGSREAQSDQSRTDSTLRQRPLCLYSPPPRGLCAALLDGMQGRPSGVGVVGNGGPWDQTPTARVARVQGPCTAAGVGPVAALAGARAQRGGCGSAAGGAHPPAVSPAALHPSSCASPCGAPAGQPDSLCGACGSTAGPPAWAAGAAPGGRVPRRRAPRPARAHAVPGAA